MNRLFAAIAVAGLLLATGETLRRAAHLEERLAGAQEQLATLDPAAAADEAPVEPATGLAGALPFVGASLRAAAHRQRAVASYYGADYARVQLNEADIAEDDADPALVFLSANAAFRTALSRDTAEAAVRDLDGVVRAYVILLKRSPGHQDAAYNYEFVVRLRDALARQRQDLPLDRAAEQAKRDLPPPPAVHGDEGDPPTESEGQEFNVIVPLRPEERTDLMKAGSGGKPRRQG